MKNLKLIIILIGLATISVEAQNKIFLGGTAAIKQENVELGSLNIRSFNLNLAPRIGIHVNENMILGIRGEYAISQSVQEPNQEFDGENRKRSASSTTGLGIFVRQRKPITKKVGFYIQAEGFMAETKTREGMPYELGESELTSKTKFFGLQPGIDFRFGKRLMLSAEVGGITYRTIDHISEYLSDSKELTIQLEPRYIRFSINYYLR